MLSAITAIIVRDVRIALRASDGIISRILFMIVAVSLIPLSTDGSRETIIGIAPSVIWICVILVYALSLHQLFLDDIDDGSIDHIIMSSVPLEMVVLCKACAHWITTGFSVVVSSVVCAILLRMDVQQWFPLFLSLMVGMPALSMIGTLGGALMAVTGRSPFLLLVIIVPFYIPTLIFGAIAGASDIIGYAPWNHLLMESAVTVLVISIFPFFTSAILKAGIS